MTVIAWDGKTLAADKQATCADGRSTCTKLKRLADGTVLAGTGELEGFLGLVQWYIHGSDPKEWPARQGTQEWSRLIVAKPGKVFFYEQLPFPQLVEDPFAAWGSGRDYALGAMAMGADAVESVMISSRFSTSCGMGVDAFDV